MIVMEQPKQWEVPNHRKEKAVASKATVIVRQEWAQRAAADAGGVNAWAEALGVDKSTISRQLAGGVAASERFIAAVLTRYPVTFDRAFDVVDLEPVAA